MMRVLAFQALVLLVTHRAALLSPGEKPGLSLYMYITSPDTYFTIALDFGSEGLPSNLHLWFGEMDVLCHRLQHGPLHIYPILTC